MKNFKLTLAFLLVGLVSIEASWYTPADACTPEGTTCTADCRGLNICTGGQNMTVDCRAQTGGTLPYCNSVTKKCDSNEDNCIENGDNTCTLGDGKFPNIIDCHRYFTCKNNERTNYACDPKEVYDPSKYKEKCSVNVTCPDFSETGLCKGKLNVGVPHPLQKHFYVICNKGLPILEVCPYSFDYVFNPNNGGCEFNCTEEGKFQDFEDATNSYYYECVKNGQTFIQSHHRCDKGTTFDPASKECVHGPTTESTTTEESTTETTTPNPF